MPQFIWNPTNRSTTVLAIYLGAKGNIPTRMVQCDQNINDKQLSIITVNKIYIIILTNSLF